MDDAVRRFRSRRADRMGIKQEEDPVSRYRKRRYNRLLNRFDAEEGDENKNGNGGGHGNTHIPFGLCEREGIDIQPDWTPKDAWDALKGKGYEPDAVYKELKETGKVPKNATGRSVASKMSLADAEKFLKDYKKEENALKKLRKEYDQRAWECRTKNPGSIKSAAQGWQRLIDDLNKRYPSLDALSEEQRRHVLAQKEEANKRIWELLDKAKIAEKEFAEASKVRDEAKRKFQEAEQKHKERRNEYDEAIKTKFPKYSDCKDKKEFLTRFNANRYFKDGHDSDFGRLDYKDAITIAEDIDEFFEMNPKMRGKLGYLTCKKIYWGGVSWPDHVELNPEPYEGRSRWKERKSPFHGHDIIDNEKQTIFHEYSHQIDRYMAEKLGLRYHRFSEYVYQETIKRLKEAKSPLVTGLEDQIPERIKGAKREEFLNGLINERVKKSVSLYAYKGNRGVHKDDIEFFAEAFSIFQLSKEPNEVCKIVGQIVKEAYDKLED